MSYRDRPEGRGGEPRSREYDRDRTERYDRERDHRGGREYRDDRRGGDRERSRSPGRRDNGEYGRERDARRGGYEGRDREYERRRDEGRPQSRESERVRVKEEPRDGRSRDGSGRSYDPNPNNEPYRPSPRPDGQPGGRGYGPAGPRGGGPYHPRGRDGDYDRPLDRRAIEEGRRRREEERARGVVYGEEGASSSQPASGAVSATASPRPDRAGSQGQDGQADEGEAEEGGMDPAMAAMMGFGGFGTTKGVGIGQNAEGGVKVNKQRTWRQYMNRRGGFNRPLDKIK